MGRLWQTLTLAVFAFLVVSMPSEAESRGSDFVDVDFYLKGQQGSCVGTTCDLDTEKPTSDKPKNFVTVNDPPVQTEYNNLVTWEMNMGGPLGLGDSYSYKIWVESSNVEEINIRTTLFISWIDFSVDPAETRMTNISVDEVTKRGEEGPFGPSVLNGNYTVELEASSLDKSGFPNGVPAYTTFGMKLETKITWIGDPEQVNHSAWIKADSSDYDSFLTINFRYVDIADDYTGYFSNDRVEEVGGDSLFIKANVTNALGVDNLDTSSVSIEVQGIADGGTFKDSVIAKDKHTYAKYIQGTWWYQEDQGIVSGTYSIEMSIKDVWGNEWSAQIPYELIVDEYGVEIEFGEGYSNTGQLPRGGKVDYEFMVHNRGNTRDLFEVELDDSALSSEWESSIISQSTLDLSEGQFGYVQVRVEAPVSAASGSDEHVTVTVTSSGDSSVNEKVRLETTVRTYGVAFVSPPDEIRMDPENLDIDGYYSFSLSIRNTGSDKDTYKLDATTARGDWTVRVEIGGNEISALTVDKSRTEKVDIVLRPVNYEDSLGERVGFLLAADSVSPGDGSATLSLDLIMEIPLDRITDLSVSVDDVLINGKPQATLTEGALNSAEPIQFQVTIHNNGGKATGSFGVKLYLGQLVIDEYIVSQGIDGFGTETVILNWENPSSGTTTLKIFVDFEQEVDELNSNRADNTLSLPIFVSERPATSGNNVEDDPLLIGPSSIITISVLMALSIFYHRKS
jgi:hypothetical protein